MSLGNVTVFVIRSAPLSSAKRGVSPEIGAQLDDLTYFSAHFSTRYATGLVNVCRLVWRLMERIIRTLPMQLCGDFEHRAKDDI